MKLEAPEAATVTARLSINWFLACWPAVVLTIISTSAAADVQTSATELNPAEQWVVAHGTAGGMADLNKQFPKEDDRQLSADFLETLLTGTRPEVKLDRHGVRIRGACISERIDLANAQIPCDVVLEHCQFYDRVSFASARFAGRVMFPGSAFKAATTFNSMKVGGDAGFDSAAFERQVSFTGADIANNFDVISVRFQNVANFNHMKVGSDAAFNGAVFEGPVYFTGADIANNLSAYGAKFQKAASFSRMKVGGDAIFDAAVFGGWVYLTGADVNNLSAAGAKFQNVASFSRMKVGGDAIFTQAVSEGPVSFAGADIANNFYAKSAKFQLKKRSASSASFNSMKVGGETLFTGAVFEGSVDLRDADFALLDLSSCSWSKGAEPKLYMQGMSYKHIYAAPEEHSHEALFKLADLSVYSPDVYSHLGDFFLRQGFRDDADRAFIAAKRRERQELHGLAWLGSWLFDFITDYGRATGRIPVTCIFLVALGCVLFSPKRMELQNPEDTSRVYSRFWYSLGLFLPFVNLQTDKVWKPKADQTFLRNYMRVHILLGWILVPLVLATLTGLVK